MRSRFALATAGIVAVAGGAVIVPNALGIVDGQESNHLQGAVQIFHDDDLVCGGTLVAQSQIITARHCFFEADGSERTLGGFRVMIGDHRLGQGEARGISSFVAHNLGTRNRPKCADIAVARLSQDASNGNQIAELGTGLPPINANVAVKGWGHVGDMKVATMRVNSINGPIDGVNHGLELKHGNGHTEGGDSGSPVMYNNKLVGLVAEEEDDPGQEATWAVEIAFHRQWIDQALAGRVPASGCEFAAADGTGTGPGAGAGGPGTGPGGGGPGTGPTQPTAAPGTGTAQPTPDPGLSTTAP